MPESSSLASVLRCQTSLWSKIDDNRPLALFHKKFWGKSMKDEEAEWCNTQQSQPVSGGQNRNNIQDGDDLDCMDHDENERMDVDNDIIPGCYALNIDIVGIQPSSLWIRADYIRIYNYFQSYYDKVAKPMHQSPSAVLTGQPGIGKSLWVYYAARRCAGEMKPFIWSYARNYYLFVNEGVYKLPPDWEHHNFHFIIWTLVDSDENTDGVPPDLVPHNTFMFVIYITSPAAERWSRLHKTTQSIYVIMNPWSREEIWQAALLSPLKMITKTHVDEIFNTLGPVPRLCVEYSSHQLEQYKSKLHRAISNITMDKIQKMTEDASELTMDNVSAKIFLLSRENRDVVYSRAVVVPITHAINCQIVNQF